MRTTQADVDSYVEQLRPTLASKGLSIQHHAWVGSTYINGEGNDIDIVVHVVAAPYSPGIHGICWSEVGLVYGGSEPNGCDDNWVSTKDACGYNIIFVTDPDYYAKWVTAAEVCRQLCLWCVPLDKAMRVKLHAIIMDEEDAS